MFPTLSSLVNYVFGTDFSWPIPTFGFFVALSFVLAYLTFRAEFVRKERIGAIKAFPERVKSGKVQLCLTTLGYAVSGFLLGFKGFALLLNPSGFLAKPFPWILSGKGHMPAGLILAMLFLLFVVWTNRQRKKGVDKENLLPLVRPVELMPTLVLWAAIAGFVGAKLFAVFENYQIYRSHSFWDMWQFSGLAFWGGLVFGAASYLVIGIRKGIDWRHLVDIGSLGMLVAYAVGRVGCHLSGDGDWGIVNTLQKPFAALPDWMWSFDFPHNVIHQGVYIPGCTGPYCYVLPQGVFPTSLYESTTILLIFAVLWMLRSRIKVPGVVFTIYLFVVGLERLLIEFIRVNYKYTVFGISLSEAQFISLALLVLAMGMSGYLIWRQTLCARQHAT